jgi:hypothetical protein
MTGFMLSASFARPGCTINAQVSSRASTPHNETSLPHLPSLPSPLYSPQSPRRFSVPPWLAIFQPIFVVSLISISCKHADPAGCGYSPSTKTWLYHCLRHYGVPHNFMARPHFCAFPPTHLTPWFSRLQTLGPDGSWPAAEIDYTSGCPAQRANWPASTHWTRIRTYFKKSDIFVLSS